jgi:hypothetical protein
MVNKADDRSLATAHDVSKKYRSHRTMDALQGPVASVGLHRRDGRSLQVRNFDNILLLEVSGIVAEQLAGAAPDFLIEVLADLIIQ